MATTSKTVRRSKARKRRTRLTRKDLIDAMLEGMTEQVQEACMQAFQHWQDDFGHTYADLAWDSGRALSTVWGFLNKTTKYPQLRTASAIISSLCVERVDISIDIPLNHRD